MKTKINLSTTVLALLCGFGALAQDGNNEEFTIYGDRELFVQDANKIQTLPQIKELATPMPSISYTVIPNKVNADMPVSPIPAAKIQVEDKLDKLYRGYAKAGIGFYTTPLVDLYFMDERSRKGSYSVNYKHLSSNGGTAAADSIPDGFSHNEATIWGKKFFKKQTLEGHFNWERDVYNYFGFDPALDQIGIADSIRQRFNMLGGDLRLKSFFRDSTDVNYDAKVSFYTYNDLFEGRENHLDIVTKGSSWLEKELLEVEFGIFSNRYNYFDQDDSLNTFDGNTVVRLKPTISVIRENLKATVGGNISIDFNSGDFFHFYPEAYAHYDLFNNIFVPYVHITGDLRQNTYRSLTNENPWFGPGLTFENTNHKLQLKGGIRGSISNNTSFNAYISRDRYEDFLFFVNDSITWGVNHFAPRYDDLTVMTIGGEISTNVDEQLRIYLKGEVIANNPEQDAFAWNLPNHTFTLRGEYNLEDKLIASLEVYTMSKRRGLSRSFVPDAERQDDGTYIVELRPFVDVNLMAEYRYTKRLSVWGKVNNLVAARYERFYNYPTQRFLGMMGASYSF